MVIIIPTIRHLSLGFVENCRQNRSIYSTVYSKKNYIKYGGDFDNRFRKCPRKRDVCGKALTYDTYIVLLIGKL